MAIGFLRNTGTNTPRLLLEDGPYSSLCNTLMTQKYIEKLNGPILLTGLYLDPPMQNIGLGDLKLSRTLGPP